VQLNILVQQTGMYYLGNRVEGEIINTRYSADEVACVLEIIGVVDHNILVRYFLMEPQ